MKRIHTIVSDLDGTLVPRTTFSLAARTVAAFRAARAAGARIIISSGRSGASMRPYVEELCGDIRADDHYIACNGAQVFDGGGAAVHETLMEPERARAAIRWLRERDVYVQAYEEGGFVYEKECAYADAYTKSSGLPCRKVDDMTVFIDKPAVKLLGVDEPSRVAALLAEAREAFSGALCWTTSEPQFLEIASLDASKGNALRYLSETLGFDAAGALAFGDSINDLPMLEWAGVSVAVSNARDVVKERATHVCGSCVDCGPAAFLEELLAQGLIG
ncbi:MAG: HAD family hydrolase [Oscillospiraceae bacterium]|jgi:Cof subfamily protein (haloacid dehalogenase superfamily)|nr:HAD family hydrolase [Oscillospiraceae bacterium]